MDDDYNPDDDGAFQGEDTTKQGFNLKKWRKRARNRTLGFTGAQFGFANKEEAMEAVRKGEFGQHSARWRNRRPICPYGCGQEGTLLEVIMKGGKAIGIYTHSHAINPFTADLQMAPKPTGRKLVIGPDGNMTYSTDTSDGSGEGE